MHKSRLNDMQVCRLVGMSTHTNLDVYAHVDVDVCGDEYVDVHSYADVFVGVDAGVYVDVISCCAYMLSCV